jgi:CO dehydrogenase maturation factor
LKIAVSGKGGVGKTTLSAGLAASFARDGANVIAVDGDPDSNLAATLGFPNPDGITPIGEMEELIAERTGAEPGRAGSMFTLNPKVDDIPDDFCPQHAGVRLLSMGGGTREGGSGCLCPENAFLRSLMSHILFGMDDVVIMDMVAGIEHLTRGTARGVDVLLAVVEPGRRSLETAGRVRRLSGDLGIGRLWVVANKVRSDADLDFITGELDDLEIVAALPYSADVVESGMSQEGIVGILDGPVGQEIGKIQARLRETFGPSGPA